MGIEQITHREHEGEILPPDPQDLPKDDPNAPKMFFDRYNPHNSPIAAGEQPSTKPAEQLPDTEVGQLEFVAPMPAELKAWRDAHPSTQPRPTHRDTTLYLKGRGQFDK